MKNNSEIISATLSAIKLAATRQHRFISSIHMLAVLMQIASVRMALAEQHIDCDGIDMAVNLSLEGNEIVREGDRPSMTTDMEAIIAYSTMVSVLSSSVEPVSAADILYGISLNPEAGYAAQILKGAGLKSVSKSRALIVSHDSKPKIVGEMLARYASDLTEKARQGKLDPVIAREVELDAVVRILLRRHKANPILTGLPGVGKTSIVEGLAQRIADGRVPDRLSDRAVFSLDLPGMIAGAKFRGEFEERLRGVIVEAIAIEAILFIDEVHLIVGGGGGGGGIDAANLLKPALARGELHVIGATTSDEFRTTISREKALLRRFGRIDIEPPSVANTVLMLKRSVSRYEDHHTVRYDKGVVDACALLGSTVTRKTALPDSAFDLLDKAGARAVLENRFVVVVADIEREASLIAGRMMTTKAACAPSDLSERFKERLVGQDAAVESVVDAVLVAEAGLCNPNRPAASMLFTGSTGVGKTEMAKILAEVTGRPLLRYDMSEFIERHSVARLIGAPPGYIGYASSGRGQLVREIDEQPRAVVLLDEFDKAHPDIAAAFLPVFDAGRMSSGDGETADFTQSIIILTSNLGAAEPETTHLGFGETLRDDADEVASAIAKAFRPEFRARLGAVIPFKTLDRVVITDIIRGRLKALISKIGERKVVLTVDEDVAVWLSKRVDVRYGARDADKIIEANVILPIARRLLRDGVSDISVSIIDDKIVIE